MPVKVLAALSGGVDSSVAAALMVEDGHEVIGVTLKLYQGPDGEAPTSGCCTVSDAEDARRVAAKLDIPYYVLDYTDTFRAGVIDPFIAEYRMGRTPNPCVDCNRTVKFARLLEHSAELGCRLVVTGHYAQIRDDGESLQLWRGVDRQKDQSYVLYMLGQEELSRVSFPVGGLEKKETRRLAASLGLRNANKPDSQDICFVGAGRHRQFLSQHAPARPGLFVDSSGRPVGRHDGAVGLTIGQRRGLSLSLGEPRYVLGIDPVSSTVVVGTREELGVTSLTVAPISWVAGRPPEGEVDVQLRAHGPTIPARVFDDQVELDRVCPAVAPGQAAVFYRNDELLGGGPIVASRC